MRQKSKRKKGEFQEKRARAISRQRFFDGVNHALDDLKQGMQPSLTIGARRVVAVRVGGEQLWDTLPTPLAVIRRPGLGYSLADMSLSHGLLAWVGGKKSSCYVEPKDVVFWCQYE